MAKTGWRFAGEWHQTGRDDECEEAAALAQETQDQNKHKRFTRDILRVQQAAESPLVWWNNLTMRG